MFILEKFSFYAGREECNFHYEDESCQQWIRLRVEYKVEGEFPQPGSRIIITPKTFNYVKVHDWGVTPPKFTRQDLEPYLIIEPAGAVFWFYENDDLGSGIHHLVGETAATIKEREIKMRRHCYLLADAYQCGFLPPELRPNPHRSIDRMEVVHRLTRAGLTCSTSPVSHTPIRVTCVGGDARSRVQAIIPNPYFQDERHEGNTTSVDLWEWGTEPLVR